MGGKKSPYTQQQYNDVLEFFQENQGSFFKISKIAQINSLPLNTTQAIVTAQVADPTTGVTTNPKSESEFGIPKKGK